MSLFSSFSEHGAGYAFSGERAQVIRKRIAYIEKHGAAFLFNNTPPPAPGWPVLVKAPKIQRERIVPGDVAEQRAELAELVANGMTIKAAGALLGKSQQRASQIWRNIVREMGPQAR